MLDADAQVRVALLQILDTAKIRKYLEGHNVNILRRQVRKYLEGRTQRQYLEKASWHLMACLAVFVDGYTKFSSMATEFVTEDVKWITFP